MEEHATAIGADRRELISFRVGDQEYCVDIMAVREIRGWSPATTLPQSPGYMRGVINLRGSVVPVVDLSARFGQGKTTINRRTCIVILESQMADETQVVGFMVDAVNAVVDIGAEFIAPPPQFGAGVKTDFLRGIGKVDDEFVLVLNVERLLDFDIPTDLEEAAAAAVA